MATAGRMLEVALVSAALLACLRPNVASYVSSFALVGAVVLCWCLLRPEAAFMMFGRNVSMIVLALMAGCGLVVGGVARGSN